MVILKVSQSTVRTGIRLISSAKGDIIGNPVNKLCPDYLVSILTLLKNKC